MKQYVREVQYGVDNCPYCLVSLRGSMVPVELRGSRGYDYYSRARYCYGSTDHDLEYLECPDCHEQIIV